MEQPDPFWHWVDLERIWQQVEPYRPWIIWKGGRLYPKGEEKKGDGA